MTDHEVAAILRELGRYIGILRQSAEATTRAEDRARYQSHLAAAAEMFESIYAKRSRTRTLGVSTLRIQGGT
jgi:hypothetical protein